MSRRSSLAQRKWMAERRAARTKPDRFGRPRCYRCMKEPQLLYPKTAAWHRLGAKCWKKFVHVRNKCQRWKWQQRPRAERNQWLAERMAKYEPVKQARKRQRKRDNWPLWVERAFMDPAIRKKTPLPPELKIPVVRTPQMRRDGRKYRLPYTYVYMYSRIRNSVMEGRDWFGNTNSQSKYTPKDPELRHNILPI